VSVFAQESTIAKRDHKRRCCLCGDPILRGDAIDRWTFADGGRLTRLVAHDPCGSIAERWEGNSEFEWTGPSYFEPGDEGSEECRAAVALMRAEKRAGRKA